jgi:hypothetical protein
MRIPASALPVVALLLCFAAVSPAPARAEDDPFAAFRIPSHAWRTGLAALELGGNRQKANYASQEREGHRTSADAVAALEAAWDSDPLFARVGVSARAGVQSEVSTQTQRVPGLFLESQHYSPVAAEDWTLSTEVRAYPWNPPIGLGLAVAVHGQYLQLRSREDQVVENAVRDEMRQLTVRDQYENGLVGSASAGVGRVRDATVVYDVHVLEQRLLESGALAGPLSARARERLAALLFVAPAYGVTRDRPLRFVWSGIERVLREEGALSERGLDAYSVIRGTEPVAPRTRFMRLRGHFIGPTFTARTEHTILRSDQEWTARRYADGALTDESHFTSGERLEGTEDSYWAGARAEVHRPIGFPWQVDATASVSEPVRPHESGLSAAMELSLGWDVADRWAATAYVDQARRYFDPSDGARMDQWAVQYGAVVAYYLEDHLSLQLSVNETQAHDMTEGMSSAYQRQGAVALGLSYRFLGAFDAPGVFEAVRPPR